MNKTDKADTSSNAILRDGDGNLRNMRPVTDPRTVAGKYKYTEREKRVALIVDQLCPIIVEDGHYVGPELFKKLTLRLTELIPYPSDWKSQKKA